VLGDCFVALPAFPLLLLAMTVADDPITSPAAPRNDAYEDPVAFPLLIE
jgi:hypothetical protein